MIVHLFPKSDAYKRQVSARNSAMKSGLPTTSPKPKQEKKKVEDTMGTTQAVEATPPTISKTLPNTEPVLTATTPEMETSTKPSITSPSDTVSKIEKINEKKPEGTKTDQTVVPPTLPQVTTPRAKPPQIECKLMNYDQVFRTKHLDIENITKEFLNKLHGIQSCKSLSIYFLKNNQFVRYIEKKNDQFFYYNPVTERVDITEEVMKFLRKKLGAFSSTHSDAVLPMVNNDQLFGAVKMQFSEPKKNLDINPIWSEIKSFSRYYHQTFLFQSGNTDTNINVYSMEHFQNILNYRVTLDISQNLTLIKILNNPDPEKVMGQLGESLQEILGKKPEIYKVNQDTVAMFISIEFREKLGHSLKELLNSLRKTNKTLDLNIGSCDFNPSIKFPQKWNEKAMNALSEAVSAGVNNYKLYIEKT